jgi:predicted TIM-barrel fold metal-dependent hydrolase
MTGRQAARGVAPRAIAAVDCHAHVMRRDYPLAPDRHSAPRRDVTVDEYLEVLDAHGISHGVLTAPSFYGTDNTLLLAALDAHPQRLRGTVIVDPDVDPAALAAMHARGAVGVANWVRRDSLPTSARPPGGRCSRRCASSTGTSRSSSKARSSPSSCPACARRG